MSYPYSNGRYSPPRYERPPFPPNSSGPGNFPPFPPNGAYNAAHTPVSAQPYRPYDPYSSDARPAPATAYPQPRDPYGTDSYDPYTPATAYTYNRPPATAPPGGGPNRLPHRPPSPGRRVGPPPVPRNNQSAEVADLTMLTAPTTVTIKGHSASVYTLPPSHLPIDKYIAVNPDDCIDIHRAICRQSKAIWYADGAARAGEGWASALQWIIDEGQSGRKMRGSTDTSDALQVELLAICKAVEGFQEVLHHSIKDGIPVSHELVIFCNSAAAIVAIDTSSRPETQHFDQLWRKICSEYLRAQLTLVWLPKGADIEGLKLADKIATVAASGSYLRRKKDGTLAEIYRRPGGGDPAPSASTIPGAWQRGDADPNFRKVPFERPMPPPLPTPEIKAEKAEPEPMAQDQNPPPPKEAVFVTSFPDSLSAKDIGVLFAQFGDLVSVDIYHTDPRHPRFAYVQYRTIDSGNDAVSTLHQKPIDFDSDYAKEYAEDLAGWAGWQGSMTVVRNDEGRFIPTAVQELFPDVATWMVGGDKQEEQEQDGAAESKKRDRQEPGPNDVAESSPKRTRSEAPDFSAQLAGLVSDVRENVDMDAPATVPESTLKVHASLPPRPTSIEPSVSVPPAPVTPAPTASSAATPSKPALTNSAAVPQEHPIQMSRQTLQAQLNLVQRSFPKHDVNNWIAHSCLIAVDLDQARRALQGDLFATDEGFINGRELEQQLIAKGFTAARVDAFVPKVLKVLDGIALAESLDGAEEEGSKPDDTTDLQAQLNEELKKYPDQTREAIRSAGTMLEYLYRGKKLQEKKRLDIERRVKVLEGMVKIGEVVGGVVRFLLTDGA